MMLNIMQLTEFARIKILYIVSVKGKSEGNFETCKHCWMCGHYICMFLCSKHPHNCSQLIT